jgi:hypothetical protein
MVKISVELFKAFEHKERYIFFFSIPNLCDLCKDQKEEYKKYNIPNLINVVGDITDEEYFMNMGVQMLPCTILFDKEGKHRLKKYGVQYETQIKKLLKEMNYDQV